MWSPGTDELESKTVEVGDDAADGRSDQEGGNNANDGGRTSLKVEQEASYLETGVRAGWSTYEKLQTKRGNGRDSQLQTRVGEDS